MQWADTKVWMAVPDLQGRPDDRLRRLLLHLHTVQRAFLKIWTGQPLAFPQESEFPTLAGVRAWSMSYYAEAFAFLDSLDETRLGARVHLPWSGHLVRELGREPHMPTLGETVFQVISHSTYHRGQVNGRLRELGIEPPLVDYIAWIWSGRPAPPLDEAEIQTTGV
jgi:uncharacterized damage-inducible protein DinB